MRCAGQRVLRRSHKNQLQAFGALNSYTEVAWGSNACHGHNLSGAQFL